MKFRFILINIESGSRDNHRTLKEIVDKLEVPYHQARSLYLADKKLYLHPKIKDLHNKYRIVDYQ
jgi:hypothetical protein